MRAISSAWIAVPISLLTTVQAYADASPSTLVVVYDSNTRRVVRIDGVDRARGLGAALAPEVRALLELSRRAEVTGRLVILRALGDLGAAAAVARPELIRIIRDRTENSTVRETAAGALEKIGGGAADAVGALSVALSDSDRYLRRAAAKAVWRFKGGRFVVDALRRALRDEDDLVRAAAAGALGDAGAAAAAAVPDLLNLLTAPAPTSGTDDAWAPRVAAVQALGELRLQAPRVVPVLVSLMSSDRRLLRPVTEALARFVPRHRPALETLLAAQRHEQARVRYEAILALGTVAPAGKEVVQALATGLGLIRFGGRISYAAHVTRAIRSYSAGLT